VEIESKTATEVVEKAELFAQAVERAFGLNESSVETKYEIGVPITMITMITTTKCRRRPLHFPILREPTLT
jgi:hypothetical protein